MCLESKEADGGRTSGPNGERSCWQGLTTVHFPAEPEPFLTRNASYAPPNTP